MVAPPEMSLEAWELFHPDLYASGDIGDFLSAFLAQTARFFRASGASVFLRRDDGSFLLTAQAGDSNVPEGTLIQVGVGVAGASIAARRPALVVDPMDDPALARHVRAVRPEIGSSLVVPLLLPDQGCLGVLNLSRSAGASEYDQSDLDRATAVAHQASLAVGNALLVAASRRSHDVLRSLMDSLTMAVFLLDDNADLHDVNAAGCELLKLTDARSLVRDATKTGRHKLNGSALWITRCHSRFGCVVTVQDISEQERLEQESARNRRLAEIGQMTAAVAHEIRNPLTGIRTAAQMITDLPDQAAELASMIEEEVVKLNRLCEDFLEFARPISVKRVPMKLAEVATGVLGRLECDFCSGTKLRVEIDADSPTIEADPQRIEQVIRNLVQNARQACEGVGDVLVRVAGTAVEVVDTGVGMTPDATEMLFTPFFTTKARGTGLGLSNVKKIVDAHGGSIQVASELGKGTRFVIDFSPGRFA